MNTTEAASGDVARIAAIYDIDPQSVRKTTSADLIVAVSPTASGQVVVRKAGPMAPIPSDRRSYWRERTPNASAEHLTIYEHQAVCWKENLRDNPSLVWKHSNGASHVWSAGAMKYLASLSDATYDAIRPEYHAFLHSRRDR